MAIEGINQENNSNPLFDNLFLSQILNNLTTDTDVNNSRRVCKAFSKMYPRDTITMTLAIQDHDPEFWEELQELVKFIDGENIHYKDLHINVEKTSNKILLVQQYWTNGGIRDSWATPFCGKTQCKNGFKVTAENMEAREVTRRRGPHTFMTTHSPENNENHVKRLYLETASKGINLNDRDVKQLEKESKLLQRNLNFDYKERNILISAKQLKSLVTKINL